MTLILLLRTVKSLRFYSAFSLTSCPVTVPQMLAEDTRLLARDEEWFIAHSNNYGESVMSVLLLQYLIPKMRCREG